MFVILTRSGAGEGPLPNSNIAPKHETSFSHYNVTPVLRLIILALFLPTALFADDLLQHLRADYENKTVLLRGFYQDSLLHYSSSGILKHHGETGSWTLSYLRVTSLELNDSVLEIHARRVVQVFNDRKRRFEPAKTKLKVAVNIDLDLPIDANHVSRVLAAIFVSPDESLPPLVPEPWRWLLESMNSTGIVPAHLSIPMEPTDCGLDPAPDAICRIDKNVRPPKVLSSPRPSYNKIAQGSVNGSSILWVVVDETGKANRIHIVKPLGCGLDERAIEAVSGWTFQPASRNGQTLPVHINVALRFNSSQFWEMGGNAATKVTR